MSDVPFPLWPSEICTHPGIDVDGVCKACGGKVALGFPVEFARRMAEIDRLIKEDARPVGEP